MKKEDKELLLKDLCCRLPYGVKVKTNNINILKLGTHTRVGEYVTDVIEPCKPYLFPLSSMTEEQKDEIDKFFKSIEGQLVGLMGRNVYLIDFFNKNHLDYRRLIKEGLAIDATGLSIYKED